MAQDKNNNILILVAMFSAAVLIAVSFFMGMSMFTPPTTDSLKTLNSSGSVTKTMAPDKVDIIINIETTDASAKVSQQENARISDDVRDALADYGITDIKTVSYYENELYYWDYINQRQDTNGYQTVNSLQITLKDLSKAGIVIDAAVQAGANRVQSVSFGLTDSKQNEVKTQALEEASTSARIKAESMARGLGVSLGKVISINENSYNYYPGYLTSDSRMILEKSSAPTQITPGDISVDASITVQFEII
jgi:uncharacterized protein YggE